MLFSKLPETKSREPYTLRLRYFCTFAFKSPFEKYISLRAVDHIFLGFSAADHIFFDFSAAAITALIAAFRKPAASKERTPSIVVPAGEHTASLSSPGC